MIVIVDYGMGNLGSVLNMLKKAGAEATISGDAKAVQAASKLILPGVGAFDAGMRNLRDRGLIPPLNEKVLQERVPILGICLGLQLFCHGSEEGRLPGLGWIEADTKRFQWADGAPALPVPHMGWNEVVQVPGTELFRGFTALPRFYFVHSYHVVSRNSADVIGKASYGYEFAAAIQAGNIFGTQFHPEKSHRYGLQLLKNFVSIQP